MKFRSILAAVLAVMLLMTMSSIAVAEDGKIQISV